MQQQVKKGNEVVKSWFKPVGTIFRVEETRFPLKYLLDPNFTINGHSCDLVYFRTKSDNIYMIDSPGSTLRGKPILNVVNLRESLDHRQVYYDLLTSDVAEKSVLEIGKPFSFGDNRTSPLVEIVACSSSVKEKLPTAAEFHRELRDRKVDLYSRTIRHF